MTTISLGYLGTALHAGCASAVARVLDAHEVEVDFVDADASELPSMLEAGAIDLLVSAWLPRDAALVQHGMRVLGTLYRPYYCWASFDDLPEVASLDARDVDLVIAARSDAGQMNALLAQTPGLDGVATELCDDEELHAVVCGLREEGRKALVFLAQPHALFNHEAFGPVQDPRLGVEMEACMLVREAVAACADQDMLDELSEMTLGNKVMSALDHAIQIDGMDPEEAAEAWQRGRLVSR
ncbi:glycine betaine ABC transporter substrate-binding protein [Asaia bogorensis]|uniref:glycine betaine ABC transporter substrate-binding protein n=1 Tax=Asaia bogorensis TaxID=91915 RepID=UPI001F11B85F|nr:glycine betaine ABC transporter substrate-binding protein [Asaia bogorensis]